MPVTPDSVKLMGVVDDPLHKVWSVGLVTAGVGLMVMVNVLAVPGQVLPAFVKLGVTVILPVMGALVVLVMAPGVVEVTLTETWQDAPAASEATAKRMLLSPATEAAPVVLVTIPQAAGV